MRLYFAEPDDVKPGQRVFDVLVQDRPVLKGFDVVAAASGTRRGVMREVRGVAGQDTITVALRSAPGSALGTLLAGVELIEEH
ncbi:MAG: malectin [Planctomycetia bacterium]|nr:malectin [Planctomycetia bacterium]